MTIRVGSDGGHRGFECTSAPKSLNAFSEH